MVSTGSTGSTGSLDDSWSGGLLHLTRMQNADGGWGYQQRGASFVEPTAAALMAHTLLGAAAPETAWRWLRTAQRADGAWAIDRSGSAPSWMTAWAVWALSIQGTDIAAAGRGARWLLDEPVMNLADAQTSQAMRRLLDLDASLTGWPWQPGEAAWVLPTALSMVALAAAGYGDQARFTDGLRYLLDRRCGSGGWNFGNPVMLGKALPATVQETALALLALRAAGLAMDDPVVAGGLGYLAAPGPDTAGGTDQAWRLLGLRTWGRDLPGLPESLAAGLKETGGRPVGPFSTAVALLALAPASLVARVRS